MKISNWFPIRSQTRKQLHRILATEFFVPLPNESIDSSVIQERIDRIYPKLLTLGSEDPEAIRWAIMQQDYDVPVTHGMDCHQTLVKVLNEVDTSGKLLLSIALDNHAHFRDREAAMRYLATRKEQTLVRPLLPLLLKPLTGEIRSAALDALARCGVQEALPIVQELYSYRAIAKERTPWSETPDIPLPRALWQCIVNWVREGVVMPEEWLGPWLKLLKARGQLGDSTALRDLIIGMDDPYQGYYCCEGLDALISHLGGLKNTVSLLCKDSLFDSVEDQLLELACHDPEEAVSRWANDQLAEMDPEKYADRNPGFLNKQAQEWLRQTFQEWVASIDDPYWQIRDAFFHPDQSVMALTTDQGLGLFRRNLLTPFFSWSPPESTNISYVDFHPSKPLLLVATGIGSNWETEGQLYLIAHERNNTQTLIKESWEIRACWFLKGDRIRVIFGEKYEADNRCYKASLKIRNESWCAEELEPLPTTTVTDWLVDQHQKSGNNQDFEDWEQAYYANHDQRLVAALKAWLSNNRESLDQALAELYACTEAWRN